MASLPLIPSAVIGSHGKPGWWFATVRPRRSPAASCSGARMAAMDSARAIALRWYASRRPRSIPIAYTLATPNAVAR